MAKESIVKEQDPKLGTRKFFNEKSEVLELPDLIKIQTDSYKWYITEGLKELFEEISPVQGLSGVLELSIGDFYFDEPKYSEETTKLKDLSYEAALKVQIELKNTETGKVKKQEVFFGDYPIMTDRGTFIINGNERVIVSQLIRSQGVFFTADESLERNYYGAKIIPTRGAWLEFETSKQNIISAKIDRKRKISVTALLRAFGNFKTNDEIYKLFADVNIETERDYIKSTLDKDPSSTPEEAYVEIYKRIRPGDLATPENSKSLIDGMFLDFRKYDLGKVGRYKINKRLNLNVPITKENQILKLSDLVEIIKEIIRLNINQSEADDIDRLDNRRIKPVGELIQFKFRAGLSKTERIIKDKMSISDPATVTPNQLINVRPIVAAINEFFSTSPLSQYMEQKNPVSELAHKRRLSTMGPGGLTKERASLEVRDVHRTHFGRICPIETPEGPNIGLVGALASYTRINDYGFLETPYQKVISLVPNDGKSAVGYLARENFKDKSGKLIIEKGKKITQKDAQALKRLELEEIKIVPRLTKEIVYLDAKDEEEYVIAEFITPTDEEGNFIHELVTAREMGEAKEVPAEKVHFMDISSKQTVGINAALIPFLEHDESKRTLMGANMQKQAVSLVTPETPLVGTGVEENAAQNSSQVVYAEGKGTVTLATADKVEVKYDDDTEKEYYLTKFTRSNDSTCINQRTIVSNGQKVKKGDILIDGTAIDNGELALGRNVLVAFMPFEGANFEDAVIISERLVKDDVFTSIHLDEFDIDVRDTKLGPEIITRDIPNVGEEALRDLDENGIVRIGAEVTPGDILVGKITPKGETELTAEERLLRAIFGEKAREVKDSSLRLSAGIHGKVIAVNIKARDKGDELPAGVLTQVKVTVAQARKVTIGDKMTGRHGNKGVISKVLPIEDMPYLEDGTPIDVILNPLGVGNRMNLGQILETHLGLAAKTLNYKVASPVFNGVKVHQIKEELKKAGFREDGVMPLRNGKSGDRFDQEITVGYSYLMKLDHLVEDKIHARSIGPYALVTQQPLGGKAQRGGQRFGEMEVWALEAYGAAHTLQEILTIKSDDVIGRSKAYESIIKGEEITEPRTPESFNVLVKELEGLGIAVDLTEEEGGKAKEVGAEELIDEKYEEDIKDLGGEKLIIGEEFEGTEGMVDLSEEAGEVDEFQVIEEEEKKED
ncbi:MAG: DNA-directed RNA polymerase subunit beta [Patescibacteria group bacterium]|nr:DNA-directed RNA polymerase subunit beta [Patescibacteria group bacterium]